eukprot:TRINITY_DN8630_c0_g1_i3.p1 TRINITY_DN8630_c0_g1~~TRINITY_DN8630_c0_g1_i3.p1  ORF type:complete len:720 (+),score=257.25 TRINITY_DN8630_c0_g1_i3:39-2162(+)
MSWGSLLNKDPAEDVKEMDKMYEDMDKHTSLLVEREVTGRKNVNQYIMDAVKECAEVRGRLLARMDAGDEVVRRHARRLALKATLLLATYHQKESCALEGYKALEAAKECLASIRSHQPITASDFTPPDTRQSASIPTFTSIKYTPDVSFENIDLLIDCLNTMGSSWSSWGELTYSFYCFQEAEKVYQHWEGQQADAKKDTESDQIKEILSESSKRASDSLLILEQERDEQQALFESKLAARRKKKSGANATEAEVVEAVNKVQRNPKQDAKPTPNKEPSTLPHIEDLETRFTQTCSCLAQLYKNQGNTVLSCYYCHLALQRQLEGKERASNINSEWVANCISLAEYYTLVKDFSHAEHCLAAVNILIKQIGDSELHLLHQFAHARYCFQMLLLLQAEADSLSSDNRPANLDGVVVMLMDNPLAVLPPEEEALLKNDPKLTQVAAKRMAFKLPIPPPKTKVVGNSSMVVELYETGSKLYRNVMKEWDVETDCEKHCLVHLELQQLIGCYQHFISVASDTASTRLELCYERLRLLQVLLNDGFDELVFRNVLRQVHFGIGCISQEIAELILSQGIDEGKAQPYYKKAAEHFEMFSARFLKEFKDIQKATSDPKDRSAFLKLEGSDAPAYVVGEMRHAQVLGKLGTVEVKEIIAKYKGIARFIETNPKAVSEYPELKQHLAQVKEIIKLLQDGTDPAKVKTKPTLLKKR